MQKYACLVLEDSLSDQLAIEMIMNNFQEFEVTYVQTAACFLEIVKIKTFSIFIIDIQLDSSTTGLDLIETVEGSAAWVIITSSLPPSHYFSQLKQLPFVKFLMQKPVNEFELMTNISSFLHIQEADEDDFILIKQGNYVVQLKMQDILFLQTEDHVTSIYAKEKKKYASYSSLKSYEKKWNEEKGFLKVNRSTLVNIHAIEKVNIKDSALLIEGVSIPVSRTNRKMIFEKIR